MKKNPSKKTAGETLEAEKDTLHNSKGRKKSMAYMKKLFDKGNFLAFVKRIRVKYEIPESPAKKNYPFPPSDWKYKNDHKKRVALEADIRYFCLAERLHPHEWSDPITVYIFYNQIDLLYRHNTHHLCMVVDIPEEKIAPNSRKTQEDDDRLYPVAIRISPEASVRDILDFITKVYNPEILELQKKYQGNSAPIGSAKTSSDEVRRRDKYIFTLSKEGYSAKEIVSIVNERFGELLDTGLIGKIISNMRKKERTEV